MTMATSDVIVFFLVSLLILLPATNADAGSVDPRGISNFHLPGMQTRHIQVSNKLTNGSSFGIHCRSKNDDLGFHVVGPNQMYEFKFKSNIWGTTLFHCGVDVGSRTVVFDVYNHKRDSNRCSKFCRWSVLDNGVQGYREGDGAKDQFFPFS